MGGYHQTKPAKAEPDRGQRRKTVTRGPRLVWARRTKTTSGLGKPRSLAGWHRFGANEIDLRAYVGKPVLVLLPADSVGLGKTPEDRYPDCEALIADLERVPGVGPATVYPTPSEVTVAASSPGKTTRSARVATRIALAAAAVVVAGVVGWCVTRSPRSRPEPVAAGAKAARTARGGGGTVSTAVDQDRGVTPDDVSVAAEAKPRTFAYVLQAERLAKTRAEVVALLTGCDRDWIVVDVSFAGGVVSMNRATVQGKSLRWRRIRARSRR